MGKTPAEGRLIEAKATVHSLIDTDEGLVAERRIPGPNSKVRSLVAFITIKTTTYQKLLVFNSTFINEKDSCSFGFT
jgi:hypothetical protein